MLLAAAVALIASCKQVEEFQDVDIVSGDAEFAIPLMKANVSIQDLLENFDDFTYIEIDSTGIIHLRYKGDVLTKTSKENLDSAEAKIFPIIPLEDTIFALPFSQPQELEVDRAVYKSGKVSFWAKSDYDGPIDFTLYILQATKNGQVATVHEVFNSPTTGINGVHFSAASVDVSGYDLIPDNDSLYVRYVALGVNGERLKLDEVYLISENVHFSYIQGYLGTQVHKGKRDTIQIEFFENWTQGDVFFEKPKIDIYIQNSFGIPTRSDIEVFEILTADGNHLPLESDFIDETGIDFPYPALDEVGETKDTTFTFDEANSNIEDVLGSRPVALDYKVNAVTNPDSLSNVRGFVTDSSYYRIQVEVDLPLHGRASGFGVVDTFDLDFGSYDDVKEAEFKLVADNTMPLDIDAQIYFLDENGVALDSLFSGGRERIVKSAEVNAAGEVVIPVSNATFSTFPAARFDKILTAKKLALQAFFSTTYEGQQSIKVFADQKAEIRMGMKLKT